MKLLLLLVLLGALALAPLVAGSNVTTTSVQCDSATQCAGNGFCDPGGQCVCFEGAIDFECPAGVRCCYKQKKVLVAFLLEFFLGLGGGGDWYLGRFVHAGCRLGITLLGLCTSGATIAVSWTWAVVNLFLFGLNAVVDGNGAPLLNW